MSLAASSNSIVSFVIFIFLSRILSPKDIGLMALALIIVDMGRFVVTGGLTQAIIQKDKWDEIYASTCFYINLAYAIIVSGIIIFIVAPLASTHYDPHSGSVIKLLSIILFAEGLKAISEGKLKRVFAYRAIAYRSMVSGLISGVVGIYLAINNYGVYALVWQQITNHTLVMLITILSAKWLPSLKFSIAQAKIISKFATPLMLAQVIGSFSFNIFEILIGIIIGPLALGFYRVGGRALFILQDMILKPFEYTALSALSRVSGPEAQAQASMRMIRISTYIIFPIFFGAAAISTQFIVFAFGEKWFASGSIMTILALGVAPTVISYNIEAALTACGKSQLVMKISIIGFTINCIVALISIPFGLTIAACGFLLKNYILVLFNLFFFKNTFEKTYVQLFKITVPNLTSSILMFLIVIIFQHQTARFFSGFFEIIIACTIGIFSHIALSLFIFKEETKNFINESSDFIPAKFSPILKTLKKIIL